MRQAVQLLDFMAAKSDALLAAVFQPLLGRIDNASENLLIQRLAPQVPDDEPSREEFFDVTEDAFLTERVRSLKRLLITRSPIMPTGLLLFCLDYASKDRPGVSGVLAAVRSAFHDLAGGEVPMLLRAQYDFRNEYIAHEKREPLRSVNAARDALETWTQLLVLLRRITADAATAGSTRG